MSIGRTLGRILTLIGTLGIIGGFVLPYNLRATTGGMKLYEIIGEKATIATNITNLLNATKPGFAGVLLVLLGVIFALIAALAGKRILGVLGGLFTIGGWYAIVKYYSNIIGATKGLDVIGSGVTFKAFVLFGSVTTDVTSIKAAFAGAGYGYILTVISPLIVIIGSLMISKKKTEPIVEEVEKEESETSENATYSYAQQYGTYNQGADNSQGGIGIGGATQEPQAYAPQETTQAYGANIPSATTPAATENQILSGQSAQVATTPTEATQYSATSTTAAATMETAAQAKVCPKCGGPLDYIQDYDRYYCYACQEYAPEGY